MASAWGERRPAPPATHEQTAVLWTLLADKPPTTPRERLLAGLAASITERGLAASTVADIVRLARASRRTFYEHFRDRDDCYLALYGIMTDRLVWVFERSVTERQDWLQEMTDVSRAYLAALTVAPALTRSGLAEMSSLGPRALDARTDALKRLAAALERLVQEGRARHPEVVSHPLSSDHALAVIGGLHELVLLRVQEDRIDEIVDLAPVAAEMVHRLTAGPER